MRWFISQLIREVYDELSYIWRPCESLNAGYGCRKYRQGGCADCGRGRPEEVTRKK
jgi:hypothetical protein